MSKGRNRAHALMRVVIPAETGIQAIFIRQPLPLEMPLFRCSAFRILLI